MVYSLKANIDDMGYQEARAVMAAIFERYGSHMVEEELKAWEDSCRADVPVQNEDRK
jgi:hypothetical protein